MTDNLEKCRVLVIDDEPEICRGIQKSLSNFSVVVPDTASKVVFEVDTANNKQEFFDAIRTEDYNIVLLDYKMPEVSGLELLEYLAEEKQKALVIMITAYATFETAVQATKIGAYDFLPKPFTPEEIRNAVKKAATHSILSRKAQEYKEQHRKARFELISVLSHELKTPLNAIDGYLDIMEGRIAGVSAKNFPKDDFKFMIDRSKLKLDGMRKLIDDLLDMTSIESGGKQRTPETLNLSEIAKSSIKMFSEEASKMHVSVKLYADNEVMFFADRSEMEMVFNKLISNAVKYNNENGVVKVKINATGDKVKITVADSGIGIPKSEQTHLFKEFLRIKNDKTVNISGSGLGLSTLQKIVSINNGKIYVKSREGTGTVFMVTFPKEPSGW
jgi:signal transduction histidine kinase